VPAVVSAETMELGLYPRFTTEASESARAWRRIPETLEKLGVRRRQKRLPDGSRPVVYFIPKPRQRPADVVAIAAAKRA
jgi:hypothetical protein